MLLHGDELGRTQDGNNNAYAQDSELSLDRLGRTPTSRWSSSPRRSPGCAASTRRSAASRFFTGTHGAHAATASALNDIVWLHLDGRADGGRATGTAADARRSACTSTATASPARTPAASTIIDDHFLLYFNADGAGRRDPAARGVRRRRGTS